MADLRRSRAILLVLDHVAMTVPVPVVLKLQWTIGCLRSELFAMRFHSFQSTKRDREQES